MYTNEFEEAFSNFLDRDEYDEAENYLFSMVRLAFSAGWLAAETTTAGFSSRFSVSFIFPSSSFSSVREWSATAFTRERIS